MSQPDTNRNLLFAIMAVQMDFIPRDAMFSAMVAWTDRKEVPLGQVFVDRGELSPSRRTLLDQLLDEHIKAHAGDPARSLQALSSTDGVADLLTRVPDADLQASLGHLRDKGRTQAGSNDIPTSAPTPGDLPTWAPADGGQGTSWTTPLAPWGNPFRVVRKHAEGGLGVVSVAIDDELDREVAYKEIKPRHADHRTSQARFVMEAEITGKLEHPGIVPIYGLGHDPQGRPYYAMRFIQGDSLADAINRFHDPAGPYAEPGKRTLQLRELLGRFLDVCDALGYAHSRGVLHRDLKPGNVMLGPFGETLVVDWGLALNLKEIPGDLESTHALLKTSKADTDSLPSEQGAIVGTLQYMPPEQAEGAIDQLGPRSDVYGLGAILYDLLTGRHPVTGTTQQELIDAVRAGNLTPPRQIRPDIPRPLEAICLKALSLRPDDRYSTPRALASDIKSFLADEPVTAYRAPLPDRLRRWSRRHRVLVSTLAATLIVGVLGLGSTLAVFSEKNKELLNMNGELILANKRAFESEQEAINAVEKFGETIKNEPLLKTSKELEALRSRLLREPHAYFKSLSDRLIADNDTRPESLGRLAKAAFSLGDLTNEIGDKTDALVAFEEARKAYLSLTKQSPNATTPQKTLIQVHNNMGVLFALTGKPDAALNALEQSRDIAATLSKNHPDITKYKNDIIGSYNNVANIFYATGKTVEAMKAYEQARDLSNSLVKEDSRVIEYRINQANIYHNIGVLLSETGRLNDALSSHLKAKEIRKTLVAQNPSLKAPQLDLTLSYNCIGTISHLTGRPQEALQAHERALELVSSLAKEAPTSTAYQSALALTYNNLGTVMCTLGRFSDAIRSYEQSKDIRRILATQNPTVTDFQNELATITMNLGSQLSDMGKNNEALKQFTEAKDILLELTKKHPTIDSYRDSLAISYMNTAGIMADSGKRDDAFKYYEQSRVILIELAKKQPNMPDYTSRLSLSIANLGILDKNANRLSEARGRLLEAVTIQKQALNAVPNHRQYRQYLQNFLAVLREVCQKLDDNNGVAEAERELKWLAASDPAVLALHARLEEIRKGLAKPISTVDRLQLAQLAYTNSLHSLATRLWNEALAAEPNIALDRQALIPYNAACAAALAGTGQCKDEPFPGEEEKVRLRGMALGWLRGELKAWEGVLRLANAVGREKVREVLEHWKIDPDLAGVRDEKALAKLPEAERAEWVKLWGEVEGLLKKAK